MEGWILTVFTLLVLAWNIANYSHGDSLEMAPWAKRLASLTRLLQRWDMFAPFPRVGDGWLVVEARLANGTTYDPLNDRSVLFTKPESLANDMESTLWRKYLTNLSSYQYKRYIPAFSRWLCREWNENQKEETQAKALIIWVVSENTPAPGAEMTQSPPMPLWHQICGQEPSKTLLSADVEAGISN
jgi:hypothetical protein